MSETGSPDPGTGSGGGNFEALEQRLLQSPTARARFLADTLELLEKNGVDVNSPDFQQQIQPSLDLTEGSRFLGGLAASTVVVAIATAGQRGSIASQAGNAASTVVVVAASAGQRGSIGTDLGRAASTVVVAIATAGQRGLGGMAGRQESAVQGAGFTVTVPAAATIADVARGLRALADLLVNESEALDQQIQQLAAGSGGTPGSGG